MFEDNALLGWAMSDLYTLDIGWAMSNLYTLDRSMAIKGKEEVKPPERPNIANLAFNEEILYDLLYDLMCHHKECQLPSCDTCDRAYDVKTILLAPFNS